MTGFRRGHLSDYFTGVVAKTLTVVETDKARSNQHEFQGTRPLRRLLGDERRRQIPARFIRLGDEQDTISEDGFLSWSNVREGRPRAPEYHLYYSDNAVTGLMRAGDMLFLAARPDNSLVVIIAPSASTTRSQLLWLFGMDDEPEFDHFRFQEIEHQPAKVSFAVRYILDDLGIEVDTGEADELEELIDKFGTGFPRTRDFSSLARTSLKDLSPIESPDETLIAWLEREELLFRLLEKKVVAERLKAGFLTEGGHADVDGFLTFSLSVQNRRKARAGHSLENHLEALFQFHRLAFARGGETENRNKPDFLFPGVDQYRDANFDPARLTMLGAKSTCKDRWRQVLSEAARIEGKHLLTLEPSISENQTSEMRAKQLQLVLPKALHETYRPAQRSWLMSVADFISLVRARQ